jgi:AAA+ ATPase superfamily predicted ATPase
MSEPIIGREKETAILEDKLSSQSAEFIAVYGRRRVGKTYLYQFPLQGKQIDNNRRQAIMK